MLPPLLSEAPACDLPDPSNDPDWYGEVWVKYPLDENLLPTYFGHLIHTRSRFRIIMNQASRAAHADGSELGLEKAKDILAQLNIWYDSLPTSLQPKYIVLPQHLQIQ